jgi:hypothetical protein
MLGANRRRSRSHSKRGERLALDEGKCAIASDSGIAPGRHFWGATCGASIIRNGSRYRRDFNESGFGSLGSNSNLFHQGVAGAAIRLRWLPAAVRMTFQLSDVELHLDKRGNLI